MQTDSELLRRMKSGDNDVQQEYSKELMLTMKEVPKMQREIIYLRFFGELKLKEIAERLNLSLNTVKTYLYKGLKKLKKILESRSSFLLGNQH